MSLKALIASLGLFLSVLTSHAYELELIREYSAIKNMIAVDRLGNIYSLQEGILKRFDSHLSIATYSNPAFGHITHVDVSNPLGLVVFFGEFGVVVILDRNLTERRVITTAEFGGDDMPQLVSSSSKGGFWAFFETSSKLARFSDQGLKQVESIEIIRNHPQFSHPFYMKEYGERVYLAASGIWAFDLFGNYLFNIIPELSAQKFQVTDNKVVWLEDQQLRLYDMTLGVYKHVRLPPKNIHSFFLLGDILYLQSDVSLKKFRLKVSF